MLSFSDFLLQETYKNFHDIESRRKYANQVWKILEKSYKYIGGIKGSGFESIENMINSIPYWKICIKSDEVVAVALYKDKNGRKVVAYGSEQSEIGKKIIKRIIIDDISRDRTYGEISDNVVKFVFRHFNKDQLNKYLIPAEQAITIVGGEVVDQFTYKRKIGNEYHENIMFGYLHKSFK